MTVDGTLPTWVLALSYWVHLLATVVWLGGLALMALVAWPAVRNGLLAADQWIALRGRFTPWANLSLAVLWVTGFLQMTVDSNYDGFLVVDTLWAQAILIKHLAVLGMMGFGLYIQWRVHPALERTALLAGRRPEVAEAEREKLVQQENRLLRLNLVCAAAVLLCTAVATAL
jgi:putative copper export protein